MENTEQLTQPNAALTDFNDLQERFGVSEVARQVKVAIETIEPVPPTPPKGMARQSEGSGPEMIAIDDGWQDFVADNRGDGGDISLENTAENEDPLQKHLARFCLIEAETNIWDSYGKKVWKKTAFVTLLGTKKDFDAWNGHPHRKTISRDDVDGLIDGGSHKKAKEMQDRFIMLEGKKVCWDKHRREFIPNDVMRDNWAGAYDLWSKSKDRLMKWHEDFVFNPSMEIDEGQINLFDGMKITPILDESNEMIKQVDALELCAPILNLLKHLCGRENGAYEWMLKWIAYPLQHPGAKMDTSILICSKVQGSGKSIFFEKVMGRIYGDQYSVTLGQNGLESIYTDWAERKLYCLFEEVFNNKSKYGMMGLIKHMITGEKIRIEKKFMSGYSQSNHINCVFLSNEIQPLAIEEQDRRFCVLAPDKKLDNDTKALLGEYIDDPELSVIRAFYTYLLRLDLGDFNQHTAPPLTKAKQEIIHFGLPSWKLFLDDWRGNFLDYPFVCCLSDDLYIAYRQWCMQKGEKAIASNKFLHFLASEKCVARGTGRVYESAITGSYSSNTGKVVQRRMVFTENQPEGVAQPDWLSSQVKQFRDKVNGDSDVPPVL